MDIRDLAGLGVKLIAALLSAYVTLHALYAAWSVDLRADTFLTLLYCIFPGLSFLVFLFVRSSRLAAWLQAFLFVGFLITASMLNWRTCAELGYCGTVLSTVLETLKTKTLLASLAVALMSLLAIFLDRRIAAPQSTEVSSNSVL
jgi:hypothetical protein